MLTEAPRCEVSSDKNSYTLQSRVWFPVNFLDFIQLQTKCFMLVKKNFNGVNQRVT